MQSPSHRRLAVLAAATALGLAACTTELDPTRAVDLDTARAELEAGRAIMIDIREPREHATGVARGARLLPMSQLRSRASELPADPTQPVLLICNTQNRSSLVLEALREQGYRYVRYVHGGMSGWVRRGWSVVPPGQ
jgi:rhodanese-related sulfurtransferase